MKIKPWYHSILMLLILLIMFMLTSCKVAFHEYQLVFPSHRINVEYCRIEGNILTYRQKGVTEQVLVTPVTPVKCVWKGVE